MPIKLLNTNNDLTVSNTILKQIVKNTDDVMYLKVVCSNELIYVLEGSEDDCTHAIPKDKMLKINIKHPCGCRYSEKIQNINNIPTIVIMPKIEPWE